MMPVLQIGLIGMGSWGKNYINTLKNFENIQLRWVCSPNRKIGNELPKECQFTNDYKCILNDNQTYGIIISTPPSTHYELARDALLAKKDILLEKPMTLCSKDAQELVALSDKTSRILMIGHIYFYNPITHRLKDLIEKGELGKLVCFYSNRSSPGPGRTDINVMWDYAPHDISLINYFTGKNPLQIHAKKINSLLNIDTGIELAITYPKNVKGYIHNSWYSDKKTRKITVIGTKKTAIFDDIAQNKLKIYDNQTSNEVNYPYPDAKSPLELECSHFFDCMINRKKPLTDAYHGYGIVKILEYAQESLDTGKEIALNLMQK